MGVCVCEQRGSGETDPLLKGLRNRLLRIRILRSRKYREARFSVPPVYTYIVNPWNSKGAAEAARERNRRALPAGRPLRSLPVNSVCIPKKMQVRVLSQKFDYFRLKSIFRVQLAHGSIQYTAGSRIPLNGRSAKPANQGGEVSLFGNPNSDSHMRSFSVAPYRINTNQRHWHQHLTLVDVADCGRPASAAAIAAAIMNEFEIEPTRRRQAWRGCA